MNRHIVVVGAAAAGLAVTEQLRRLGYDGDLSLVGAENHPPYDRPPLSKRFLAGELSAEQLRLAEPEALDRLALSLHRGRRAVTADLDSRTVTLDDGTVLTYTALVVATGVAPRGLSGTGPSDGGGEQGDVGRPGPVGTLKTLDDARALAEQLRPGRRVVIAGGGFLGTKTTWTALALGCEVTLVNRAATPLAVLGDHVGSLVGERLRAAGAALLTGRTVRAVHQRDGLPEAGRLTVLLNDGTRLRADAVLGAIGSVPATDWLASTGLDLSDGVRCDAGGRAAPGVYACGDVASWYHPRHGGHLRLEHRMHAGEQARVVAANLLGGTEVLNSVPFFWTDQGPHKIVVHGLLTPGSDFKPLEVDPERDRFTGVYRLGGRPVAVLAWNSPKEALRLRRELLTDPQSADAPTPAAPAEPAAGTPVPQ
ncbi:NAD(P)/FAD-dependent oxidoreductase [Streptomyces sp. NPDC048685]|uniref:NAD(P)/FAD-dependent oxidoreductase n=1 Tax=Streptomyces sp. NPDC048685 TaxID=3365584 RepID=UPI0037213961